jgi:hypothetical protein
MFASVPLKYGDAYANSMDRAKAEIRPPAGAGGVRPILTLVTNLR